jgi:hypothetical protein
MKEAVIFMVIFGAIVISGVAKSQTRKPNISKEWIKTEIGYFSVHLN